MPLGPRVPDEILTRALPAGEDLFAELSASVRWEELGKGRRGAVLTRVDGAGAVPLVRTTTRYGSPAQRFRPVHERLARRVRELLALPAGFDNALVERYTNAYRTMGAHSDQALDLADGSFIAVFSCYERPGAGPPRKLLFESKESGGQGFGIPLVHNGVVAFSLDTNRRFKHRIVLEAPAPAADNQWLGVTFRTSKTSVRFRDGHAYLPEGARLTQADEEQAREFYRLRRRENDETGFAYPPLAYTVSGSDLLPPV
ncbi:alpha-ketoglutarate-dependent dioxygenase AlkB [Streptomyces racemochromogenes]|uniref:alpha-ketoglutarate-dependent dioxygenase AlkB n=1 Tax=Streptomyces racemochromogenes TaxID=67353 RepID=UPI0031EB1430